MFHPAFLLIKESWIILHGADKPYFVGKLSLCHFLWLKGTWQAGGDST
jgi:hypothetical protein